MHGLQDPCQKYSEDAQNPFATAAPVESIHIRSPEEAMVNEISSLLVRVATLACHRTNSLVWFSMKGFHKSIK